MPDRDVPPKPPRRDFPLQPYGNGQWGKKIKGVRRYFGAWADPAAAEALYWAEKADWEAGRNPRLRPAALPDGSATLLETADRYLVSRREDLDSSDEEARITAKTYAGCERAMKRLLEVVPEDFKRLRAQLGERVSVNTKAQYVVYVRAMFNWAVNVGKLLPRLPDWADQFRTVSKRQKDKSRYLFQKEHGERRFELEDARRIILACERAAARIPGNWGNHAEMKMQIGSRLLLAGTLLGANCGPYSKDIAALTFADVDLDAGYVESLRSKTGFLWQATLWPETVAAIRSYLEVRPAPARVEWSARLFLTAIGFPVHHETRKLVDGELKVHQSDALGQATAKLLSELGLKTRGVSFGAWRHTFSSLAGSFGHDHIIKRIMGHEIQGSLDDYMKLRPEQLRPVTEGVRGRLLGLAGGQNLRPVA
jgi:integrase